MTIDEIKAKKIELGLTNEWIAEASRVPLSTVQKIMSGQTKAPRKLTIDAIVKALSEADVDHTRQASRPYSFSGLTDTGIVRESTWNDTSAYKKRKYTLDDYYALPDDQRVELIDGVFYDMAAPAAIHQIILGDLYILFRECAERHGMPCHVFLSPFDVRLDKDNYTMVQPDLVIFCHDFDINMKRYEGAPDLAVEILSPSTRSKDMVLKLYKYQQAGVKEYWIVDPKNRAVTVHFFDDPDYDPRKYTFHDKIPVNISGGTCVIDFSRVKLPE